MPNQLGSPANTDVIIVGTDDVPVVKIINVKDMEKAGKVANGLASWVREETLEPLQITKNPEGEPDTIRVEGRMSINKDDFNSRGAIATSLVIGLVKTGEMDMTHGFNALARFAASGAIDSSMQQKALKKMGYEPKRGGGDIEVTGPALQTR